jgi:hypothetical protein
MRHNTDVSVALDGCFAWHGNIPGSAGVMAAYY